MEIKTSRLLLFPLSWKELDFLTNDLSTFEKTVSYLYDGESISGIYEAVLKDRIYDLKDHRNDLFYHTFWMIVLRKTSTIIGSLSYKGSPNDLGQVEIAYGLGEAYKNKGYMTEALDAFIEFTKRNLHVKEIQAKTLKTNIQSQNVLGKLEFKKVRTTRNLYYFSRILENEKDSE